MLEPIIEVVVTAASATDNLLAKKLLDKVAAAAPTATESGWMPDSRTTRR